MNCGDNNKGKILGVGTISNKSSFNIKDVLLVEGLKHNLISISQLCDEGYKVVFEYNHCLIFDTFVSIVLVGKKSKQYILDLHHASNIIHCFLTNEDDTCLWHKRICRTHMHNLIRLNRNIWLKNCENSSL